MHLARSRAVMASVCGHTQSRWCTESACPCEGPQGSHSGGASRSWPRVHMPPAKTVAMTLFWRALKVLDLTISTTSSINDAALAKCTCKLVREAVKRGTVQHMADGVGSDVEEMVSAANRVCEFEGRRPRPADVE